MPNKNENLISEIKYKNGDIYNGMIKNNKRHGKGKMIYHNGNEYYGMWKNNKKRRSWINGLEK